jgi:alkanesulfonate monooxygenase SsuD/methylene tetrahydromethanopterin reductase-like flavin-dependent oxidoreductase (luciferase family)
VLGVAIGARDDDYEASGVPTSGRGKRFEEMLDEMKRTWAGEERGYAGAIGPPPAQEGGPPLVIGGGGEHAVRRAVEIGDGWTMGGGTPDQFKDGSEQVKAAWSQAGRDGDPRLIALCYYALGDGAREAADSDLRHYYAWLGDLADQIAQSAAVSPEMAQQYRDAFAEAGADELIYFPCSTDPAQVDLLAEAVL